MRQIVSGVEPKHLFIVNDFPPVIGGQSSYLFNLCRALPPEKVIVLAPSCGDTNAFDRSLPFRVIRRHYLVGIPVIEKFVKIVVPLAHALGIIRKENIVRLHCAHVLSTGIVGLFFRKFKSLSYVVYTHSADILEYARNPLIRPLLKALLLRADFVMANSRFTARELQLLGVPEHKAIRSCPRIDYAQFAQRRDASSIVSRLGLDGKTIILSVNRLIERKGNDVVIKALPGILERCPEAVYVIFGRGPMEKRLRRLVSDMKLEHAVRFVGGDDNDKIALLQACQVMVMVSRAIRKRGDVEGFGVVYLEANACARPVVAGNSGGVPDAVEDGVNGFLVEPEDTAAVRDAVVRLLSDPALSRRLGEQGRQRVIDQFDYRQGVPELAPVFEI